METTVQLSLKEYEKLKGFEQINKEILESENYERITFHIRTTYTQPILSTSEHFIIETKDTAVKVIVEECIRLRDELKKYKQEINHWKEQSDKYMKLYESQLSKNKWWQLK